MIRIRAILLLITFLQCLYGQEADVMIHRNYDGIPFISFCDSLYRQQGLAVQYKEAWVEDVIVKQVAMPAKIREILDATLSPAGLKYITDHSGNIILIPDNDISPISWSGLFEPAMKDTVLLETEYKTETEQTGNKVLQSGLPAETITVGEFSNRIPGKMLRFSGIINEASTGEPIAGAVLYIEENQAGAVTDHDGYFVLSLPTGDYSLGVRYIGMKNLQIALSLNESGSAIIELEEEITALRGVVVISDKGKNVKGMQIGLNKISSTLIKQVPAIMGEADVLKTAILLPGVQTVGEGAAGFNVRGGSTDQNLILLNGSPVFNSSHFFGFFSAFNPDLVKEFSLYKSGIPAEYGGRISSVFDITTKSGNKKQLAGSGGISPVTSRLLLEGPIKRDKGSYLVTARSTYSDFIMKQFDLPILRQSEASFYDGSLVVNQQINHKNELTFSAYTSGDRFRLNSDTVYRYRNINGTLEWKHAFTDKLINSTRLIYSHYNYQVTSSENEVNAFDMKYAIDYIEARTDFRYYLNNRHSLKFGGGSTWYLLQPGSLEPFNENSLVIPLNLESEQANELALYGSDEIQISQDLSLYGGVRVSLYRMLGPKTVHSYEPGPRELDGLTGSSRETGTIQTYGSPELRLSARYRIDTVSSMKLSYNMTRQYLHRLSNTTAISPTDVWKLSDPYIRPQTGHQVALGYYRDLLSNNIETSVEVYYKSIRDMIEYKGGASLILNEYLETDLVSGNGRAYGVELLVRKKFGRLNGLISYTYARTLMEVASIYPEETINRGQLYPANYDKPHDLTGVINFRFNRRLSITSNLTYSSGRPITYPVAKYVFMGNEYVHYSFRNEYRVPDYFRWDVALNLEGNLKSRKLAHSSWSLSVYNLTGRNNVYSVFFLSEAGLIQGYKLSIFAEPVPTLTYSFTF